MDLLHIATAEQLANTRRRTHHRLRRPGDAESRVSGRVQRVQPRDRQPRHTGLAQLTLHSAHAHEPRCALRAAAEAGDVDLGRYDSYRRMMTGEDEE